MKLAIQEHVLPGSDAAQRLGHARKLGFDGIEFSAVDIGERIMDVAHALDANGLAVSALNLGGTHLIHTDYEARDGALAAIRQAMADSLDLGSGHVIFRARAADTPHLPDLRPFHDIAPLEGEFLAKQLRTTLGDLAYAMGAELHLAAANRYECGLLNTLDRVAALLERNKNHPHIKLSAGTFHMALEENDLYTALATHAAQLGSIHLADHNGRLPGEGWIDFSRVISTLRNGGYDGWLTVSVHTTKELTASQRWGILNRLPNCVEMLREAL